MWFRTCRSGARGTAEDDIARYQEWTARGMAGEMRYFTDRRADVRQRSAKSAGRERAA